MIIFTIIGIWFTASVIIAGGYILIMKLKK